MDLENKLKKLITLFNTHGKVNKLISVSRSDNSSLELQVVIDDWHTIRTIIIWDNFAVAHKYVHLLEDGLEFLVAMPLSLIELHKEILDLVKAVTNLPGLTCDGGGYLKFENKNMQAYGASQAFGPYQHQLATQAFSFVWFNYLD